MKRYAIELHLIEVDETGAPVNTLDIRTTGDVSSDLDGLQISMGWMRECLGNAIYDHQFENLLTDRATSRPRADDDDPADEPDESQAHQADLLLAQAVTDSPEVQAAICRYFQWLRWYPGLVEVAGRAAGVELEGTEDFAEFHAALAELSAAPETEDSEVSEHNAQIIADATLAATLTDNANVRMALTNFWMWQRWHPDQPVLAVKAASDFLDTLADVDEFKRVTQQLEKLATAA